MMDCKGSARESMAFFRFDVIAPLLSDEQGVTLRQRLKDRAKVWFALPDGRSRYFSWMTLEDWLYRYQRGGLEALCDDPRQDLGKFRTVSDVLQREIGDILEVAPRLKASNVIRELENRELENITLPSRSTLFRYIDSIRSEYLSGVVAEGGVHERRSFEAHYSNQIWQADIMYGPKIPKKTADGRWRQEKTYLIAIIDDYSRLIVHAEFMFSQNLQAWFKTLKLACSKRGIPGKLYCDNGQVFRSDQIKRICALMGTQLVFTQVRDAAAKGKIERFFKRVRGQFLEPQLMLHKTDRLDKLNEAFRHWLENDYSRSPHRGISQQTPNDRWLKMSNNVRRLSDHDLENKVFLFHAVRKVTKVGTISLNSRRFETAPALAGEKVDIYYDPSSPLPPAIWFEGSYYGRTTELSCEDNLSRRRHKPTKGEA